MSQAQRIPSRASVPRLPSFQRRYEYLLWLQLTLIIGIFGATTLLLLNSNDKFYKAKLEKELQLYATRAEEIFPVVTPQNQSVNLEKQPIPYPDPGLAGGVFLFSGGFAHMISGRPLAGGAELFDNIKKTILASRQKYILIPGDKLVEIDGWWLFQTKIPDGGKRILFMFKAPSFWARILSGPGFIPVVFYGVLCLLFISTILLIFGRFINPVKELTGYMIARYRNFPVDRSAFARLPVEWRPWFNLVNQMFDRIAALEKEVEAARKDRGLEKKLLRRFSWVFEKNERLAAELKQKNEELKREIEKHKQTALELARHRDHLDEIVKERTSDLVRANRELREAIRKAREMAKAAEEANRAKSQFLANVSHEVRTPLNAVIGFTDMLIDTSLSESQLDYAQTIRNSGEALLTLINDILDFSKIEAGELELESIDFSPELLAYDVCEWIRPKIGDKPIELVCSFDEHVPPYLKGDPVRFQQVLTNLLGNAPKFTESGEIGLHIGVDEEKDGKLLIHVKVTDTGIGIPEEKLSTIFDPFRQADGSTTRKYGGTGLGLSISRKLARMMGGDVWAESEVGMGSTFHFTAWLERSAKAVSWQEATAVLAGKLVLIVDDNQANLDMLANALKSAGMRVSDLRNGMEVLQTLERAIVAGNPFDCCIIDIHMPGMSGYDVARAIRAASDSRISQLPLIAASYLGEKDPDLFSQVGFNQAIIKPVRREKLFHILGEIFASDRHEKPAPTVDRTARSADSYEKISARILVAEDNPVNQKLVRIMLEKLGCEVVLAENGRVAVEAYKNDPYGFDLVFLDIQMPEMDGFAALEKLREMGCTIPIVAMTAHAMQEHKDECIQAGMDDYVTKPIRKIELLKVLKRHIKQGSSKTRSAGISS